ncbi:P-loop containing nucleoside triphosphate hydrolase protein [Fistulina hepatica ATCC 64428]|uniref:Structural maintenance of chromosomes protein 5 n=1 Tax=Fistulina hepatica ATCC 64428 TaxID=1128425 RepID=A0A0D7A7Y9_9AGAR|nr:P-loop containing nucleoside triphosphate hydrolase protein [Fistulina hepatica ATCC 64428]
MTRRVTSAPSDNVSKENHSEASSSQRRRNARQNGKRRVVDESDDEHRHDEEQEEEDDADEDALGDEEDEEEAEEEQGSPKGRKRARANTKGDAERRDVKPEKIERVKTLPRAKDGYIPGSIVRIQLRNFVTYDFVEFKCGPYLNMILGPNGTGKSSIACAICLGLNNPPSVLGRASEISAFVKLGTLDGHIEIELKGAPGEPNLVIRRMLKANSKSSAFTINEKPASGGEVKVQMEKLNVQVGNLCSFLPQDKVSEFAQMSPQQLLRETQRAAGDERLTSWHDTLISAGKDLRQTNELVKHDTEQIEQLTERNRTIERDVQRVKERQQIEYQIAFLDLLIPVMKYREMKEEYDKMKDLQRKLHEKVRRLKEKNGPAHEKLKYIVIIHDCDDSAAFRDRYKKQTAAKLQEIRRKYDENEGFDNKAEDITRKLEQLKRQERDRVRKIQGLEESIEKLDRELNKDIKVEKKEDVHVEMRALKVRFPPLNAQKSDLLDQIKRQETSIADAGHALSTAKANFAQLDNVEQQKLANLQRWDMNTYDALMWLRKNQHRFKMGICEPPLMGLNVPIQRYAAAVESNIAGFQMKTFVAQCIEDSDLFNSLINDNSQETLGRPNVRVTVWFKEKHRLQRPPFTPEEMEQLGFEGYAMDFIECPDGLKWYLQSELQWHRTAISRRNVDVNQAMEIIRRPGPDGELSGGATFVAGQTINRVTRSAYGQRLVQNLTLDLPPARNLQHQAVASDVRARHQAAVREAQERYDMAKEARDPLYQQAEEINKALDTLRKEIDAVNARLQAITNHENRLTKLKASIEIEKNKLENLRNEPSSDTKRKQYKQELVAINHRRIALAKVIIGMARSAVEIQEKAVVAGLQHLQISANRAALKDRCDREDEAYNAAYEEFNRVDKEFVELKTRLKQVLDRSNEAINEATEDVKEEYAELESKRQDYLRALAQAQRSGATPPSAEGVDLRSSDDLQGELEMQEAKLELNMSTNPGVVEMYEKRKRNIDDLQRNLEERQRKARKIERNIESARTHWQPALERLVNSIGQKFSATFDRIGCAGEIRIHEDEDYEKWAIDILVKFRDNEKLQLLTGQRQSGGERSLTTILYLMSLTEEARAPFSLVDEINQGMDQRAERMVHNSMVDVTCKEDSCQYFLITPKLLGDLNYHERMKILCVNNGEWLPKEAAAMGNLMDMIAGHVNMRKANGAKSN